MKNPFKFDIEVAGEFFCGREDDIEDIKEYIENSTNVIMFSKRRIGKSSLIKEIFANSIDKSILTAHIDIYAISSTKELYEYLKVAVEDSLLGSETSLDKLAKLTESIRGFFIDADVVLTIGVKPNIKITSTQKDYFKAIVDLFNGYFEYLEKNNLQAVVAIDEFQKIVSLTQSQKIEETLRTIVNKRKNCSFIFTGSKRNMLLSLFNRSDRPFFKLGSQYHLDAIDEKVFYIWTKNRLKRKNIFLDEEAFKYLYNISDGETRFIQMISYELFKRLDDASVITVELMSEYINRVIKNNKDLGVLLDTYTINQQNALKIVAKRDGKNIYNKEILDEYEISKGTCQTAISALLTKGVLFNDEQVYQFEDVELKLWLSKI
ncbi:MAG: AAA family ATPase [Sulfurimonas sp.]|nr:AAA family ATPase [Sulfurimonas sp.]